MDKNYDHKKYEAEIYEKWESSGVFKPSGKGDPYTVLMPPPNANASLHAGHAMYTIDDIMIRLKRMQGFSAQWLPGLDHAGFETQFVYEKQLAKEGKSRLDFDRQTLYDNIFKFVKDNSGLIYEQFRRLGFSADWSASVFTLDPQVISRVFATFQKMESEGLVYRDEYIVNFCPHCGTSLAELEVEYIERIDPLLHIKYGPFVIATVRPETKFRDTALAVNPKDKRYKKYLGQTIEIMGLLGPIKMTVIPDPEVDMEFGTGIMKVTPAHDPHDFELGKKHNLPVTPIIDFRGRMDFSWYLSQANLEPKYKARAEKYHGQKVAEMRKLMLEDFKEDGLLEKIDENYSHRVGTCYKCGRVLEPMVIPNWFIKVAELKKPVIAAVTKNEVKFSPPRFKKQMLDWLKIMHDWPISRQIAWGIRIPIWYGVANNPQMTVVFLDENNKTISGTAGELVEQYSFTQIESGLQKLIAPKDAQYQISADKPSGEFLQETDTFDTWFSSGQWPLVTGVDLPTDFLGTLADILKFWVSRMIMFSMYLESKVPFKNVYLWSMVADAKGVKMSKSKGNVINPIDFVDKYGADALRMTLVHGIAPGGAVPLSENKVRGMRNFSNKIWNAARFVSEFGGDGGDNSEFEDWFQEVASQVNNHVDKLRLGQAAEILYEEFWHGFCDIRIEEAKQGKINAKQMKQGLGVFLKLLHPFMPFVTEAVWQELEYEGLLISASWPE